MSAAMDRPIVGRQLLRRRGLVPTFIALALVAIVAVALSVNYGQRSVRVPARSIATAKVEHGVFYDFVPLRGKVVPRDVVYIDSQEGGRVERVVATSGDMVTAGQLLLEFGNTALQLEVIDREAMLIQQINALRTSQVDLERTRIANERALAELDYTIEKLDSQLQRRTTLGSEGFVSAEERDDLLKQLDYYRHLRPLVHASNVKQEALRVARLPEVDDSLRKLQQNLQITRSKLDGLLVRAPVAGRISDFKLVTGEIANRGQRIAQITPASGFKVVATLDEFYLGRVAKGQEATLEHAGKILSLHVALVSANVEDGQFTVDLAFEGESPPDLLPGQALQGRLRLGEDRVTRFIRSGPFVEQTAARWVFVLSKDGTTATRRTVRPGRRSTEQIEILEGLEVGETVLVSDYRALTDADSIRIES